MDHDPLRYEAMFEDAGIDGESLTVVLVDYSAYAVAEIAGGVVAYEHTGYADPSPRVLAALSELGGAAAVTRSNIQAHERFGCALDGEVVFDADEFMYVDEEEKAAVPPQLRPIFDSAWFDLDAGGDAEVEPSGFVGFAMAAMHTDAVVTAEDLTRAAQQGYHRVRTLTYLE